MDQVAGDPAEHVADLGPEYGENGQDHYGNQDQEQGVFHQSLPGLAAGRRILLVKWSGRWAW